MIDIERKEEQLEQITEAFWSDIVQEMLDRSIKKSVILLERYAIQETPTDQGRLRNDFHTEFKRSFGRLFNPTDYAVFVHEWTRPHYAPIDKITGWALRHSMKPWALRLSIARKGTKANPFMDRAVEQWEKQVDEIFSDEIDKMFLQIID